MNKPTLIIGASTNPDRYAYKATVMLSKYGHTVYPVGIKSGAIEGIEIITGKPVIEGIDSVTLYIGSERQKEWYDYIIVLNPKRVIFNPGTENNELVDLLLQKGIKPEIACTLVLLSTGQY